MVSGSSEHVSATPGRLAVGHPDHHRVRPRHIRVDRALAPALDRDRCRHDPRHHRRRHFAHHGAGVLRPAASPRVWFNETYRGTYQLIGLLREARELIVIGSHPVASTPYLQVCDEVIDEPDARRRGLRRGARWTCAGSTGSMSSSPAARWSRWPRLLRTSRPPAYACRYHPHTPSRRWRRRGPPIEFGPRSRRPSAGL